MISSSKQCFSEKQWHFLSIWNNYSRLKILCSEISFTIWDAGLCNCYSFYKKDPEPAPEKWTTMMWAERHQMRVLEFFSGLLSYPVGIQMCCPCWCKEWHNDCWGLQGLQTRTLCRRWGCQLHWFVYPLGTGTLLTRLQSSKSTQHFHQKVV